MGAHWTAKLVDNEPHLHVFIPVEEIAPASPHAVAFLCYVAASTITRFFAAKEPAAPYVVVVDPEPHYTADGSHVGACVALQPWPGSTYLAEHPECREEYLGILQGFAGVFNEQGDYRELREVVLPEPDEEDEEGGDGPAPNAPGPADIN